MRCRCNRQSGLSLLEFTLVVIIFAVLVVLAFERIAALRADVERAAVAYTTSAMRTALALEFAALAARGRTDEAGRLAGTNVLALLDPPPGGYQPGASYDDWQAAPPGTWFFDATRRAVVYRAESPGAVPDDAGAVMAAWRAVAEGRDRDGDGRVEPGREPVSGVALERVDPATRPADGSRE